MPIKIKSTRSDNSNLRVISYRHACELASTHGKPA
jgi:hypothetical protein